MASQSRASLACMQRFSGKGSFAVSITPPKMATDTGSSSCSFASARASWSREPLTLVRLEFERAYPEHRPTSAAGLTSAS